MDLALRYQFQVPTGTDLVPSLMTDHFAASKVGRQYKNQGVVGDGHKATVSRQRIISASMCW
jgi:hypothetical protein